MTLQYNVNIMHLVLIKAEYIKVDLSHIINFPTSKRIPYDFHI